MAQSHGRLTGNAVEQGVQRLGPSYSFYLWTVPSVPVSQSHGRHFVTFPLDFLSKLVLQFYQFGSSIVSRGVPRVLARSEPILHIHCHWAWPICLYLLNDNWSGPGTDSSISFLSSCSEVLGSQRSHLWGADHSEQPAFLL